MQKKLLLIFMCFFLMGMGGSAKQVRFISPWTLVMGGETVQFVHALGTRPLVAQTWAAYAVTAASCQADFTEVYASADLRLSRVNASGVWVENLGDAPLCIQVVAEP